MAVSNIQFNDLDLSSSLIQALHEDGIESTFPIQELAIPLGLKGYDIIGQAKTGTGKTLGFGLPLLEKLLQAKAPGIRALILAPTRELASQVGSDLGRVSRHTSLKVVSVYGGAAVQGQADALAGQVDVIVATPGRLLDFIQQGKIDLSTIEVLVLDEADEMLDMGFLPDVEKIISMVPKTAQKMLFSATMPGKIMSLARGHMNNPTHIHATNPGEDESIVEKIEQHVWRAHPLDKPELVAKILQAEHCTLTIIFCSTKRGAAKLYDDLKARGFKVSTIHGDLGQKQRESALEKLRNNKVQVLVATDVAARGLDIEGVSHVVNYDCPDDENTYLHRIGRTGRAGASGVAVTLVDWEDIPRWQHINKQLGLAFTEPIETYSNSPHLFTGLGIDPNVPSRLVPEAKAPERQTSKPVEKTQARTTKAVSRKRTRINRTTPKQ
ncbi:MAG: hypothetical protein RIS09_975 [Actinomycetota bacterium]